jgi:hypothetical protein
LWRRVILCKKEGHHIVGGLVFRTADEGRGWGLEQFHPPPRVLHREGRENVTKIDEDTHNEVGPLDLWLEDTVRCIDMFRRNYDCKIS